MKYSNAHSRAQGLYLSLLCRPAPKPYASNPQPFTLYPLSREELKKTFGERNSYTMYQYNVTGVTYL